MNDVTRTNGARRNSRIRIISVIFALAALIVLARLFFWQVVDAGDLQAVAHSQYFRGEELNARRGSILSNDGYPLVTTRSAWTLSAEPKKFDRDLKTIARLIAEITAPVTDVATRSAQLAQDEESRILKLISREDARWVLLREKLTDEQRSKINDLKINGINLVEDQARLYPEGSMSASILGFVGKNDGGEDQGYFGLEGYYDVSLSGKGGYVRTEKDARGNPIPFGAYSEIEASDGLNLVTFIDRRIQLTLEKKIKEGVEKYGAKSGMVMVMRPTGEIIGAANYPSYDPSRYSSYDPSLFKNPIVANSFEPGSIFKILIMAAGLDAGVVRPDTKCDICAGPISIDKYAIQTYNGVYYPDTTMEDVILHSDNTGMVFVARSLGLDRLLDYLQKFGIGQSTGVDLQEEASPTLREKNEWSEVDLATSSFGQGVAVTAMQFTRAVAVVANDGVMPSVRIVKKMTGNGWEEDIERKQGVRVISKEAADEVTNIMARSVDLGEGVIKWAKPDGFKIAGKSGTAQVPENGKYTQRTIASFVGFAPADDPQFVMLVTFFEPTANPWGANTAAPVWFQVAKELLPYFGIQPNY